MTASLRLFGCVPAHNGGDFVFLRKHLVLIAPTAAYALREIKAHLIAETLNGKQLNASLHKSWSTVQNSSIIKLAAQQFAHYLSNYGWRSLGIEPQDEWVYLPVEQLDLPDAKMPIRVIHGIPAADLIQKALRMLASGVALKQETIEAIFELLDDLNYKFTGQEIVKNKEAAVLLADKSGILPKTEASLFRYLFYQATNSTLVIKSPEAIATIKASDFALPIFNVHQLEILAQGFNRRKPLWLAFKQSNDNHKSVVNKLAKLSKKHHKALSANILGEITSAQFTASQIREAAKKANPFQLIKAINAVRVYAVTDSRFHHIRNGKGWARQDYVRSENEETEQILLTELKTRLKDISVYYPDTVDYALPTSEKQFTGAVPKGSCFRIPNTEEFSLFGIYWEGKGVDLDLKAIAAGESIGWNNKWRNKNRNVMFSGDVTTAPKGATEWIYAKRINEPYLLTINLYSGKIDQGYKIICGYGSDVEENYMMNPAKVQLEAPSKIVQKQMLMGIIIPTEFSTTFYLIDQGMGGARVAGESANSKISRSYFVNQAQTALMLSDLFSSTSKEQADLDLSPQSMSKDSLLSLFK